MVGVVKVKSMEWGVVSVVIMITIVEVWKMIDVIVMVIEVKIIMVDHVEIIIIVVIGVIITKVIGEGMVGIMIEMIVMDLGGNKGVIIIIEEDKEENLMIIIDKDLEEITIEENRERKIIEVDKIGEVTKIIIIIRGVVIETLMNEMKIIMVDIGVIIIEDSNEMIITVVDLGLVMTMVIIIEGVNGIIIEVDIEEIMIEIMVMIFEVE